MIGAKLRPFLVEERGFWSFAVLSLLCVGLGGQVQGCDTADQAFLPEPDREVFEKKVYPILLRDCAFPACHGNKERMFQVYGPGRTRIPKEEGEDVPQLVGSANEREIDFSYQRARSMLLHRGDIRMAPLLRKPLQGSAHFGTDRWKKNVYRDQAASGYAQLVKWAEEAGQ